MDKKVLIGVIMVAIFVTSAFIPMVNNSNNISNYASPYVINNRPTVRDVHYGDLVITTKNISSSYWCTVNSINTAYFNISTAYEYYNGECHFVVSGSVSGKVTGNTAGCVIITDQFEYTNGEYNSTGQFKEYHGFIVFEDLGFYWYGSAEHNYVGISVNAEVYTNGYIFMQYSIGYSEKKSKNYAEYMDITNLIKHICAE